MAWFLNNVTLGWIQVFVELTSHGNRLNDLVEGQHRHLQQVQENVKQAQRGTGALSKRIEKALEKTWQLEQRIKSCSNLPGLRHKPLTEAELTFKSELGEYMGLHQLIQ